MAKPELTFKNILNLISRDVRAIKKRDAAKQLDPIDALTLTRYASALHGIAQQQDKAKSKVKKDLSKLSTEELLKIYEDLKKPKVKDKETP